MLESLLNENRTRKEKLPAFRLFTGSAHVEEVLHKRTTSVVDQFKVVVEAPRPCQIVVVLLFLGQYIRPWTRTYMFIYLAI